MNQTEFWRLIDNSKAESRSDPTRQIVLITHHLLTLPLEHIVSFERIYQAHFALADRRALWEALWDLVGEECNERFTSLRIWLITQGEEIYAELLQYPGRLREFLDVHSASWRSENLSYVGYEVYEFRTGLCIWDILRARQYNAFPLSGYGWLEVDRIGPDDCAV